MVPLHHRVVLPLPLRRLRGDARRLRVPWRVKGVWSVVVLFMLRGGYYACYQPNPRANGCTADGQWAQLRCGERTRCRTGRNRAANLLSSHRPNRRQLHALGAKRVPRTRGLG